jgi:phage tail tape-measure protein
MRDGTLRTTLRAGAMLGVVLLAACGTNPDDRTTGGAAAGAGTGAAIGIVGGPIGVVVGAVIGGGAGALTGATTKPADVNLGPPPWSKAPD